MNNSATHNPNTCPTCGQPIPCSKGKAGRKPRTQDALRARYGDGQEFASDDAARELGVTQDAVRAALRAMARKGQAQRQADALASKSGQWAALWRLT